MGKFKVRKDRILFVDTELTCWDGEPPAGQEPEIIEIGVAEVDVESAIVLRSHSFLVRPEFSEVSEYCTALTNHTPSKLRAQGKSLSETARLLRKNFGSASKAWFAWGADQEAIIRDCLKKKVDNPFSAAFHNLGQSFSMMMGASSSIGLTAAMDLVGLARSGREHLGDVDAIDTARLWIALSQQMRKALDQKANEEASAKFSSKF